MTQTWPNWVPIVEDMTMKHDRIEIDPRVCGGRPIIKGTRIPVATLIDQLAAGDTWDSLIDGYPELSRDDIEAALRYASGAVEHPEFDLAEA